MILLTVIANAVLLWLGYYWLGVGESSVPRLVWSAVLALAIVCAALVVNGAAFVRAGVVESLKTAARHLSPLMLLALASLLVYALLGWWRDYSAGPAFQLASWLTLKMRKPVKPESVLRVFNVALWVVRWVLLPWVIVPLAGSLARDGWRGFGRGAWRKTKLYWLAVPVLVVAALWAPLALLGWVPALSTFAMQMFSFIARAAIAYGLFAGGLVALARVTSSERFKRTA